MGGVPRSVVWSKYNLYRNGYLAKVKRGFAGVLQEPSALQVQNVRIETCPADDALKKSPTQNWAVVGDSVSVNFCGSAARFQPALVKQTVGG